jgi:hypothetical protein
MLEPYEHLVTPPSAVPDTRHFMPLLNRFDQMAAALSDYPLEMIMGMGGKGGGGGTGPGAPGGGGGGTKAPSAGSGTKTPSASGGQKGGMFQYITMRQRARSRFYTREVRRVFLMAYGATMERARKDSTTLFWQYTGRVPSEDEVLSLEANLDVQVFFPRTPLLSFDEMVVYYQHGLISEKDFSQFALDVIGLGDKAPPDDYAKVLEMMYRTPLEQTEEQRDAEIQSTTAATTAATTTTTTTGAPKSRKRKAPAGNTDTTAQKKAKR